MKQLALISYAMTGAGLLVLAAAIVAGLSPLWQLTGALLLIAGGVKIAVVQIWQRLAGL
jgi:predicted branched-subunit amino acid permease